jgi:hypothetical protein
MRNRSVGKRGDGGGITGGLYGGRKASEMASGMVHDFRDCGRFEKLKTGRHGDEPEQAGSRRPEVKEGFAKDASEHQSRAHSGESHRRTI